MDYVKTYNSIIENAKLQNRQKCKGIYYEIHHIKPRSLFPELIKEITNLVLLTGREHFICHMLLVKIYNCSEMWYAINMMINTPKTKNKKDRGYPSLTARTYEIIRKNVAKAMSKNNKGKGVGELNPFYGKTHSDEVKQILSIKHKKENLLNSTIELMRKNNTGINNPSYKHISSKEDLHITECADKYGYSSWRFRKPSCGVDLRKSKRQFTKEEFIDFAWDILQKAEYKKYNG